MEEKLCSARQCEEEIFNELELPIQEHNFHLHKSSFRDALYLRYGWELTGLPTSCVCGKSFTVDHCLSCPHGGYTITRHNELRNITANLLQKVCPDVQVEPTLQPLSSEHLLLRSSNRDDGARLDVAATNFWTHNQQRTYFDVRVFNPLVPSNSQSLALCYKKHMNRKRDAGMTSAFGRWNTAVLHHYSAYAHRVKTH